MEILVKVTDAELEEMDMTMENLHELIVDSICGNSYGEEVVGFNVEVINADDAELKVSQLVKLIEDDIWTCMDIKTEKIVEDALKKIGV